MGEEAATIQECDEHLRSLRVLIRHEKDALSLELLWERTNRVLDRRAKLKRRAERLARKG